MAIQTKSIRDIQYMVKQQYLYNWNPKIKKKRERGKKHRSNI